MREIPCVHKMWITRQSFHMLCLQPQTQPLSVRFGVRLQIILYNKTIQKARAFALTLHSEKGKEILVFVDGKIPADKRFVAVKAGAPN